MSNGLMYFCVESMYKTGVARAFCFGARMGFDGFSLSDRAVTSLRVWGARSNTLTFVVIFKPTPPIQSFTGRSHKRRRLTRFRHGARFFRLAKTGRLFLMN